MNESKYFTKILKDKDMIGEGLLNVHDVIREVLQKWLR
jgi:hypothetical protein